MRRISHCFLLLWRVKLILSSIHFYPFRNIPGNGFIIVVFLCYGRLGGRGCILKIWSADWPECISWLSYFPVILGGLKFVSKTVNMTKVDFFNFSKTSPKSAYILNMTKLTHFPNFNSNNPRKGQNGHPNFKNSQKWCFTKMIIFILPELVTMKYLFGRK